MAAHSTRPGAGNGEGAPEKTYRSFPIDSSALRRIAYARTAGERWRWAWVACFQLDPKPNEIGTDGLPTAWTTARLLWLYSKNGPRAGRLTLLDAWRIVCDWMHSQNAQRQGGDV